MVVRELSVEVGWLQAQSRRTAGRAKRRAEEDVRFASGIDGADAGTGGMGKLVFDDEGMPADKEGAVAML